MNSSSRTGLFVLGLGSLACAAVTFGAALVGGTAYYLDSQRSTAEAARRNSATAMAATQPVPVAGATATPQNRITAATVAAAATRQAPRLGDVTPGPRATPTQPLATAAPQPSPNATVAPAVSAETTRRQLKIWDDLWRIVNTRYVYKDFRGVDWAAEKTRVNAVINAGMTDEGFHAEMKAVIDKFGDDHSNFETPAEVKEDAERKRGTGAYTGIGITTGINEKLGYVYVLQVRPGSPAEAAGIKAHDHILQVEGESILDASKQPRTSRLRGAAGTTVRLTIRTPGGAARDITATRGKVDNNAIVESKLITSTGKKIGYILLPTFSEDRVDRKMRDALQKLNAQAGGALDGLIVDVRHNGGGQFAVLNAALGIYTSGDYGRLVTRDSAGRNLRARADALGNSQTLPLAVLTGRSTASAAEIFAGALQFKGRAIVVGAPSSGNIEALLPHDFDDGSRAWIAQEAYQLPNGSSWEGKGLKPDVPVAAEWDEFTGENDPVIDAAARALSK